MNKYEGSFEAPSKFPFGVSGTFVGKLTFSFAPSAARAQALSAAPGTLSVSLQQVDFQLAPTAAQPLPPSRPQNISTRLAVGTDNNVMIAGFIIQGSGSKKVIIRGLGPSLTSVPGPLLQNPTLELFDSNNVSLAQNDNWKEHQTQVAATKLAPTNDAESAIVVTLAPGVYTAILAGKDKTTGVGLVEVYDLSPEVDARLANISTRGFVQTGDNVMIGGFIVGPEGAAAVPIVVRAIGPSLNLPNALQDPTLRLVDAQGTDVVPLNDDWVNGPDQDKIAATDLRRRIRRKRPCMPFPLRVSTPRSYAVRTTPAASLWWNFTTCSSFPLALASRVASSGARARKLARLTARPLCGLECCVREARAIVRFTAAPFKPRVPGRNTAPRLWRS